jgi:hypothetical protein
MQCLCAEPDRASLSIIGPIEQALKGRRSIETALVDLRATHDRRPSSSLERMIQRLQSEIAIRKQARSKTADVPRFRNV